MSAEIVETSKVYARTVAVIDPGWALDINPALLKYHHYEPHWQARSGRVMAFQRVSLYGLVLVDKQRVHYGPVDPLLAREILIRSGLVEGHMRQSPAFLRQNLKQVDDLEQLESKFRRRDLVVDEQAMFVFYDERLPDNITTTSRLKSWLKNRPDAAETLRMDREHLLLRQLDESEAEQFPDQLDWEDLQLKLGYHFEPGHEEDGVSVTVPVGLLNRIPRYRFEWLVPGLLREKCIALVKALPKVLRKNLVPVPDIVDRALADMPVVDRPLMDVLAKRLETVSGARLSVSDWQDCVVDDYYRMNFRIVDAEGKLLRQGRDLQNLVAASKQQTRDSLQGEPADSPATAGLAGWSIGELPAKWRTRQAGVDIESYPALADRGESVDVEIFDYAREAELSHRRGLVRLYRFACADQVRFLRKQLLRGNDASLVLAAAGMEKDALLEDLVNASFSRALLGDRELPRGEAEFKQALEQGRGELVSCGNDYESLLLNSLGPLAEVRRRLPDLGGEAWARKDIENQLEALYEPDFLYLTPWQWISHYPRYMKALDTRLQRLSGQQHKDRQHTEVLAGLLQPLMEYLAQNRLGLLINPELRQYRWLLEELRVSFFAQSLGTAVPVSAKRLQEQWHRVLDWDKENPV